MKILVKNLSIILAASLILLSPGVGCYQALAVGTVDTVTPTRLTGDVLTTFFGFGGNPTVLDENETPRTEELLQDGQVKDVVGQEPAGVRSATTVEKVNRAIGEKFADQTTPTSETATQEMEQLGAEAVTSRRGGQPTTTAAEPLASAYDHSATPPTMVEVTAALNLSNIGHPTNSSEYYRLSEKIIQAVTKNGGTLSPYLPDESDSSGRVHLRFTIPTARSSEVVRAVNSLDLWQGKYSGPALFKKWIANETGSPFLETKIGKSYVGVFAGIQLPRVAKIAEVIDAVEEAGGKVISYTFENPGPDGFYETLAGQDRNDHYTSVPWGYNALNDVVNIGSAFVMMPLRLALPQDHVDEFLKVLSEAGARIACWKPDPIKAGPNLARVTAKIRYDSSAPQWQLNDNSNPHDRDTVENMVFVLNKLFSYLTKMGVHVTDYVHQRVSREYYAMSLTLDVENKKIAELINLLDRLPAKLVLPNPKLPPHYYYPFRFWIDSSVTMGTPTPESPQPPTPQRTAESVIEEIKGQTLNPKWSNDLYTIPGVNNVHVDRHEGSWTEMVPPTGLFAIFKGKTPVVHSGPQGLPTLYVNGIKLGDLLDGSDDAAASIEEMLKSGQPVDLKIGISFKNSALYVDAISIAPKPN